MYSSALFGRKSALPGKRAVYAHKRVVCEDSVWDRERGHVGTPCTWRRHATLILGFFTLILGFFIMCKAILPKRALHFHKSEFLPNITGFFCQKEPHVFKEVPYIELEKSAEDR